MEYQTFEPSLELCSFVKCYWTLEDQQNSNLEKQTIVPDGCMEMIFHQGDLYQQYDENGMLFIQPRCFVFGQLTKPLEIKPTGRTSIFSVRFHPNGFLPFCTIPIKNFENKPIELKTFFNEEGILIESQILNAKSSPEKIKIIEAFLLKRLENKEVVDKIIKSAVETLVLSKGKIKIEELVNQEKISRRQLERNFTKGIGLSPKQLSKTIRLQAALQMLLNKKFTSLTKLAYDNNYYDQAHFIKDFKELTGYTPKEFYGENTKLSSLFYREK